MGSSTSNLQDFLNRKTGKGIHFDDIYNLPSHQILVMEVLTEAGELAYDDLIAKLTTLPDDKQLSQSQIDGTLYELVRLGYVLSFIEDGVIMYMVQKKKPQKRDEQRLWDKLDLDNRDDF